MWKEAEKESTRARTRTRTRREAGTKTFAREKRKRVETPGAKPPRGRRGEKQREDKIEDEVEGG